MKSFYKLLVIAVVCVSAVLGINKAEAYTFAYSGLYNKVEITSLDSDRVERNVDVATEVFVSELSDPRKNIEVFDSTPDVTLQRYNEMKLQLQCSQTPVEFKQIDAEYIIYGSVDFIATGSSTQGLIGINGSADTLRVDVSTRIIERKTGKIVFTATGKGESKVHAFGTGNSGTKMVKSGKLTFPLDSYYKAVEAALLQTTEKIKKAI